jgi:hypothetical protein
MQKQPRYYFYLISLITRKELVKLLGIEDLLVGLGNPGGIARQNPGEKRRAYAIRPYRMLVLINALRLRKPKALFKTGISFGFRITGPASELKFFLIS